MKLTNTDLKSKNTVKLIPSLRSGGMFIVGYAGPNPGQFGYREEAEFADAYNAYHGYLARGWSVVMAYETPGAESAILIYQGQPLTLQEVPA